MYLFYIIVSLLVPAILIFIGLLWRKHPPKQINMIYGYRTSMSMKNQDTWDFAHKHFRMTALITGIILAIFTSGPLLFLHKDILERLLLPVTIVQCILLILDIIPTELALRKYFDKNGNRKSS